MATVSRYVDISTVDKEAKKEVVKKAKAENKEAKTEAKTK
jgi:hypothetical protein